MRFLCNGMSELLLFKSCSIVVVVVELDSSVSIQFFYLPIRNFCLLVLISLKKVFKETIIKKRIFEKKFSVENDAHAKL